MYRYRRSVIAGLVVLILLSVVVLPPTGSAADTPNENSDWQLLLEVVRQIETYYLRGADGQSLWEGALRGIMGTLNDPYSEYLDPKAYAAFMSNFESSFGGVGMRVQKVGDYVTVVAPIEGTPAAEAGIQSGDKLVSVDGNNVVGEALEKVVSLMRGDPGTTVVVEVLREGQPAPLTFRLVRAVIQIPSVASELVEPGIGYLRLQSFNQNSGDEIKTAIANLREQGAKAFILDLRNNPGGLLTSAVEVAGQFLPDGTVVQVVDKNGQAEQLTSNNADPAGIVVVFINRGSASASEIVAGALQDRGYGVLMGSHSFGKGTVQSLIPLSNGGALKLTTAEYLLPTGRSINGKGLEPDVPSATTNGQLEDALALLRGVLPVVDGSEDLGVTLVAGSPVSIKEGGLVYTYAGPFLDNGIFYVPVRAMQKLYDADIMWDPSTGSTQVFLDSGRFVLMPGSTSVTQFGGDTLYMNSPVIVRGGRTYVPAEFLQQTLNLTVHYDEQAQSLKLY